MLPFLHCYGRSGLEHQAQCELAEAALVVVAAKSDIA